eukprot:6940385-Alexandrium_andersonii.AAC.1
MQPKAAECCRMHISAASGGFAHPCAPLGALSPRGAQGCATPPKQLRNAACCGILQLYAA